MFVNVCCRCVEEFEDIVKKTYRSGAATGKPSSPGLDVFDCHVFLAFTFPPAQDTQSAQNS